MIKAEKLKELIEKESTIYSVQNNKIFEVELKKGFFEDDDTSTICKFSVFDERLELNNDNGENEYAWLIEYLFETKSEAEFYAKYGNIEKTVKMPVPPTWEEFKKKKAYAFKKDEDVFLLKQDRYDGNDMFIIDKITFGEHKNIKTWHFVEDFETVYYEALDKMVELWMEEV